MERPWHHQSYASEDDAFDSAPIHETKATNQTVVASTPSEHVELKSVNSAVTISSNSTDFYEQLRERLREALHDRFTDSDRAAIIDTVQTVLSTEFPEVEAVPAIKELRRQATSEKPGPRERYPGRLSPFQPIDWLRSRYGDELRAGTLGPGRLRMLDQNLYLAVRGQLAEEYGLSLKDFLDQEANMVGLPSAYQRRVAACAQLLGIPDEAAARFFSTLTARRAGSKEAPSR